MASGSKSGAVEVVFRWYINKVLHYAVISSLSGRTLVCSVVSATEVAVT
jgi:hypothetical protein